MGKKWARCGEVGQHQALSLPSPPLTPCRKPFPISQRMASKFYFYDQKMFWWCSHQNYLPPRNSFISTDHKLFTEHSVFLGILAKWEDLTYKLVSNTMKCNEIFITTKWSDSWTWHNVRFPKCFIKPLLILNSQCFAPPRPPYFGAQTFSKPLEVSVGLGC